MRIFVKLIKFKEKYSVTNDGLVWSNMRDKFLRTQKDKDGYKTIVLRINGKATYNFIHRLVAEAFVQNYNSLTYVNHKNGVKSDNRAVNLEWITKKDNNEHAFENGLHVNPKQSLFCISTNEYFESQMEASRKLKISQSHISAHLLGKRSTADGYVFIKI